MRSKLDLHRVRSAIKRRLGIPNEWVEKRVGTAAFTVRDQTFAETVDYDDAWMYACAAHSQVVFDVGANLGQSALLMLAAKKLDEILLIDANAEALSVAADNLIRNQLSGSCRFVRAFAGDSPDETIDFWTVGTGAAGSMYRGHAESASEQGRAIKVPTVTLDDLAARYDLVPDLVKIDVEGAEHKVLCGSRVLARKMRTRFVVEMHSPPELPMRENATLVLEWARSVGYQCWYLSTGAKLDDAQVVAHRGRFHTLIQPADWEYPTWLIGIAQSALLP